MLPHPKTEPRKGVRPMMGLHWVPCVWTVVWRKQSPCSDICAKETEEFQNTVQHRVQHSRNVFLLREAHTCFLATVTFTKDKR